MDLAAITAFVTVGNSGGFRAAASILGITSSGVSKAVARLEERLGVQLLARTTRSVRLTPAGVAFHARCRTILADLSAAEHQVAEASRVPRGRLIVAMPAAFGRKRVLPVIADYVKLYPQVDIEARLSDRFVDLVVEGVDLAVRIGQLPDSGLIATRLAVTSFILCGSPDYLAAEGVPSHPDDLKHHRFVGYVTPNTARRFDYRFVIDGQIRVISFPSQLTVDDGEALVAAALSAVGLAVVQDYFVADLVRKGRIVRLLRSFETPSVPISILHLPSRHLSPAARALIQMLRLEARRRGDRGRSRTEVADRL